jgi:methylmalonyl-CoA mutase cobalamin-binding subunit
MPDTVLANGRDFQSAMARERDTSRPVVLIGFQQMENLGLGYLTSTLRAFGYEVLVFDFEQDPKEILKVVRARDPFLVGLSLIFQLYVPQFRSLVSYLRDNSVDCHFTIGGHFPSLSYDQTLDLIPGLDTVVRFEGELTLLELADCISTGGDFRSIKGTAYLEDGKPVSNWRGHRPDEAEVCHSNAFRRGDPTARPNSRAATTMDRLHGPRPTPQ